MSVPTRRDPLGDSPRAPEGQGWRDAALARGYTFRDRWDSPPLPGLLFREATSLVARDVVQSAADEYPFTAGSLTAQYGPNAVAVAASFIAIDLPRPMPNIVLVNARRGALRRANIGMGSRQMMRLEGSYDGAFTLYCPIGAERVAAEIFTTDLLEIFVDSLPSGDIELFGECMFIYDEEGRLASSSSLDRVERVALRVQDEMVRRDFATLREPAAVDLQLTQAGTMRGAQFVAVLAVSAIAAALVALWGIVAR